MVREPLRSTATARVDYYRCEACRHVWTTAKDNTDVLTHVTEPTPTAIKAELPSKPGTSRIA